MRNFIKAVAFVAAVGTPMVSFADDAKKPADAKKDDAKKPDAKTDAKTDAKKDAKAPATK
jgi:Ni/Co efflux regulator RcnB